MKNEKRIFALGFFDGVHLGHQALLRACVAMAREHNAEPAAITFRGHPMSAFSPEVPPLINSTEDRLRLLEACGIRYTKVLETTKEVMSTPWRAFLELLMGEGAVGFVCGDDFRFGFRGEGDAHRLEEFCRETGLPCVIVSEQSLDDIRVSSTYIRRQLESGDMATAVRFLGHPHILTGSVVRGQQLGRKLGMPTANLRIPAGLAVPRFGVYICRCTVDGKSYPAVTNIGTRPTVEGQGITVEPWILDYSGDLYDRPITLEFYRFLRAEQRFDSLEALREQIARDAEETRQFLKTTFTF